MQRVLRCLCAASDECPHTHICQNAHTPKSIFILETHTGTEHTHTLRRVTKRARRLTLATMHTDTHTHAHTQSCIIDVLDKPEQEVHFL